MAKLEDYTIGVGALGNVYLGKLNKKGNLWLHKKDVTSEFIGCIVQKYGPSHVSEVITDGKHTHNIIVVTAEKDVIVNGKPACGPIKEKEEEK